MSPPLDPAAAEEALAIARQQRRRVVDASREPWWAWLVVFLLVFAVSATRDFSRGKPKTAAPCLRRYCACTPFNYRYAFDKACALTASSRQVIAARGGRHHAEEHRFVL